MGLDRRGFVKLLVGGAAGTLFTPLPWKLTDDLSIWTQNWSWIPKNPTGPSEYVPVTSKVCPSACGLLVRTVGGLPIRAIGDPDHALSQGKISSLAAAEVQMLYSPARTTLNAPLLKSDDGAFREISWDKAMELLEQMASDARGADKTAFISGDENGTVNEVFSAFTAAAGSSKFFVMPGEAQQVAAAWKLMGGVGQLGYDFESADYVLAIGADVLESWGTVVSNRRAFAAGRTFGDEIDHGYAYTEPENTYVYVGPVQNNTAAGADTWVPALPGSQVAVALGLINELAAMGASAAGVEGMVSVAQSYNAAKVEELTGIPADTLKALAKDLADAAKPLVVVGSEFGQGAGVAAHMAGIALNKLIGGTITNIGNVPAVVAGAMDQADMLSADLVAYLEDLAANPAKAPKLLMVYEANPFYALPDPEAVGEAFKDTFKVALTSFFDETAHACDLVLPVPMGLERADDVCNPFGCGKPFYAANAPVLEPIIANSRIGADVVLNLADKLGMDLGFTDFMSVLKAKATEAGASFNGRRSVVVEPAVALAQVEPTFVPDVVAKAAAALPGGAGLTLTCINRLSMGTEYVPCPPFNLKLIRDTELEGMDFFVQMNSATASALGLFEGQAITLQNDQGSCRARVHLFEGVMTNVVAAPLGFGHTNTDEYTEGKGDNVAKLLTPTIEAGTGVAVYTAAQVTIA